MSNRNRKRKKDKNSKKYNSWLAVIFFTLIDTLVSFTGVVEVIPLLDVSDKLGEKGIKRQEYLSYVWVILIIIACLMVCLNLVKKGHTDMWIGVFVLGGILVGIAVWVVYKKTRSKNADNRKK